MTKLKGSSQRSLLAPKQVRFVFNNEEVNSKKFKKMIEEYEINQNIQENDEKFDKSVQVNFADGDESTDNFSFEKDENITKDYKLKVISEDKITIEEEEEMSGDFKLEIPIKKKKKELVDAETSNKNIKKKNNRKKSNHSKHKSTYDRSVFLSSQFEPKYGRIKHANAKPIKLTVTLKDIGLEGLDSYTTPSTQRVNQQGSTISEEQNQEEIEKMQEQMRLKKVQEEWEKRKEIEKNTNTYDPKIFRDPAYSPTSKLKLGEAPPIKLNVELKDIGLEGLDSFKTKKDQESKIQIQPKVEKKEPEDIEKIKEQMRLKKVQEEWEIRKDVEKHMYTYDPKVFRTSCYSPTRKLKPEDAPPIKLNVELKDIGLEGLDSFKTKKDQESKIQIQPKIEKKEPEDIEKIKEQMRLKKVQEEWEKRKEIEKNTNTYDPKIFRDPAYSPISKLKLEEAPPIKLNVELKDIGLEGLDSYTPRNKPPNTPKKEIEFSPSKNNMKTKIQVQEPRRIKKDKENYDDNENKFVIKQPTEKPQHSNIRTKRRKVNNLQNTSTTSTYDRSVFQTNSFGSPKNKLKEEDIKPIKLNVSLKDIGLEGLDSYTPRNKPKNTQKVVIVLPKEPELVSISQKSINTNSKSQRVNNNYKKETEKPARKSTYDRSIFSTSSCAFTSALLTAEKSPPIKLNVTLKDIGLEGLDSF